MQHKLQICIESVIEDNHITYRDYDCMRLRVSIMSADIACVSVSGIRALGGLWYRCESYIDVSLIPSQCDLRTDASGSVPSYLCVLPVTSPLPLRSIPYNLYCLYNYDNF
ncbi:hypothetical protein CBL_00804 [Carabus blaptoides fortunei]